MAPLLAHQGGWDELALFVVPAIMAFLAIRWAERRAKRRAGEGSNDTAAHTLPGPNVEEPP